MELKENFKNKAEEVISILNKVEKDTLSGIQTNAWKLMQKYNKLFAQLGSGDRKKLLEQKQLQLENLELKLKQDEDYLEELKILQKSASQAKIKNNLEKLSKINEINQINTKTATLSQRIEEWQNILIEASRNLAKNLAKITNENKRQVQAEMNSYFEHILELKDLQAKALAKKYTDLANLEMVNIQQLQTLYTKFNSEFEVLYKNLNSSKDSSFLEDTYLTSVEKLKKEGEDLSEIENKILKDSKDTLNSIETLKNTIAKLKEEIEYLQKSLLNKGTNAIADLTDAQKEVFNKLQSLNLYSVGYLKNPQFKKYIFERTSERHLQGDVENCFDRIKYLSSPTKEKPAKKTLNPLNPLNLKPDKQKITTEQNPLITKNSLPPIKIKNTTSHNLNQNQATYARISKELAPLKTATTLAEEWLNTLFPNPKSPPLERTNFARSASLNSNDNSSISSSSPSRDQQPYNKASGKITHGAAK